MAKRIDWHGHLQKVWRGIRGDLERQHLRALKPKEAQIPALSSFSMIVSDLRLNSEI